MEPFFLRCETCQARLRVRDERFLGQVQSCPKCGSMVHIVAPAGLLAANEGAAETAPEITEVAATSASSVSASTVAWVRDHAVLTSVGAAAVVATFGLAAFLALRGDTEVAAVSPTPSSVSVTERSVDESAPEPIVEDTAGPSYDAEEIGSVEPEETPPATETAEPDANASSSFLPLVSLDSVQTPAPEAEPDDKPARTLTLEPVKSKPQLTPAAAHDVSTNEYAEEVETDATVEPPAMVEATPEVEQIAQSLDTPTRRTNIADQLAVPIESVTLPDMPIGEFVAFVSTMTAVPIELDTKVLGEVGLSSRSTVTVHGESTTAGKLLARVLKDHELTCTERDGTLVVVRCQR